MTFDVREFLRGREALLIHFSTVMGRPDFRFPADMQNAWSLKDVELSFSTIQAADTFPLTQGPPGGAEGSVGIIVDIAVGTEVISVRSEDSGSSDVGSAGLPPTAETCADSIDQRKKSNEWRVRAYRPVAIYVLLPLSVRKGVPFNDGVETTVMDVDHAITLHEVADAFPERRIISTNGTSFVELDRTVWQWRDVAYDDIISNSEPT